MLAENVTKKRISHEKWSAMLDRIMDNGHPLLGWYPTMEDAEYLAKDPVDNYEFILWIPLFQRQSRTDGRRTGSGRLSGINFK